jgi:NhaP-type Na+/H+ or K+/H+ antiporter
MTALALGMGLIAVILLISALASGIVERAPLSFPIIFLGLGFVLGANGLGVIEIDTHNPVLEAVATISLSLVLFLDAVQVQVDELRREWRVPFLTLIPGTLLVIGGIALAAHLLLGLTPVLSLLLGAILASTDPVVLRDILRDERVPRSVRRALGIEAGMNDIVVLPIVLVLIAVLTARIGGAEDLIGFVVRVLLLSPLVGLAVGGLGARLMGEADRRFSIRSEYQAMYGIGLVLAAFFAGAAINGDGFLAAFFAGLAVNLFNVSLCNCFMDYGEVTAEMMMLLAFVLFGAVLSTLLGTIVFLPAFTLAIIALFLIRPAALWLVLQRATMSRLGRLFIGWFGPRGLNSLLLALLVVQAGAAEGEYLLAIAGLVVVTSVVAHGTSATPLSAWYARRVAAAQSTMQEERESTFVGLFEPEASEIDRISVDELAALLQGEHPPLVLDVRSRAHYERDAGQIPGSVRVLPDLIEEWASNQPRDRVIVAYCTCPDEASSGRASRQLRLMGFDAKALLGGYKAWEAAGHPIEPKGLVGIASVDAAGP